MKEFLCMCCFLMSALSIRAQKTTIEEWTNWIQQRYGVHFIYSSELNIKRPYKGISLEDKSLKTSLNLLFVNSGIAWKKDGKNIILKILPAKKPAVVTCILTGYIKTQDGESVINASLFDLNTKRGVLTNEHGYYYMPLTEGKHTLRGSYVGCEDQLFHLDIHKDLFRNIVLKQSGTDIKEVIVNGDARSPLLSTQTGKRTLTAEDINTEFALLSSPDVVKTLQQTSGVASGVEGASGLYVHGGENDENLFLLDNSPLYNINHSLGLFSSFNSDIIKNVDFYKSGFPARYGGRVSSVTDVRTREGDLNKMKGSFSLGLLDGRIQLEGPIIKNRTSYNIALRRSWLDVMSKPVFALVNKGRSNKFDMGYLFYDFNAKVTHHINGHSLIWLSLYSGYDHYNIHDKDSYGNTRQVYTSDTNNDFKWGNMNAALNYSCRFSRNLSADLSAIFTRSKSNNSYSEEEYYTEDNIRHRTSLDIQDNQSELFDTGLKADFDWHLNSRHHFRFGTSYMYHSFHPHTNRQAYYYGNDAIDTTALVSSSKIHSNELAIYAEDEMHLSPSLSVNTGARSSLFSVRNHHYFRLDPRIALKYQLTNTIAFKMSYTLMSQYVHRIASTYLDMPTDYWVPVTDQIKPMNSRQIAGGVYYQPSRHLLLTLEGFYKRTNHQLQYRDWMGLQPAADRWEKDVMDGKGKSYGMEADARYSTRKLLLSASYTLSWNWRYFAEIDNSWFRDQFDNRHKLYLSARWHLSSHTSLYASWQYHSGNHFTLSTKYVNLPDLPGEKAWQEAGYIYGKPNNYSVPAYHRLDIGFNFSHKTPKGHERIWNISIYNAYCHLNTMYIKLNQNGNDGHFEAKCHGYIPIIPSVSYTLKF